MDDILMLAPTRWHVRRAVKVVNQTLQALGLEKHPDKTFIGKIERGFDFLGYHFSPAGVAVAKQTITNFIEKASRLYEQERRAGRAAAALEMYVRRWVRWSRSGMNNWRSGRYVDPHRHRTLLRSYRLLLIVLVVRMRITVLTCAG
ncbi:MAG: hypothetical protein HYS05_16630 [Acidobacteria bacterium]|nr:hypothetical protein [Acidobacteriota bacterium]